MRTLPESISSSQELGDVIAELHTYAAWFSHTEIKQRTGAKSTSLPPDTTPQTTDVMRLQFSKKTMTLVALNQLITDLERLRKSAPKITITLVAPIAGDQKKSLVMACRKHITPGALVSFRFNRSLLGGMVLVYGSHIFDWSFRRNILDSRDSFAEVLRRV